MHSPTDEDFSSPTGQDQPDTHGSKPIGILTFVLGYDDLAADRAAVVAVLDETLKTLSIGRGPGPSVKGEKLGLPDTFVSRVHATIKRGGPGHVYHNESAQGSLVNGKHVDETVLCDGDLIEAGHCLLSYRWVARSAGIEDLLAGRPTLLGPTRTLCPDLLRLAKDLEKIATTNLPVLLLGETGTGKDVIARHLHGASGRGPFVPVNCAAIPEALFESTLFGHARGAFTGATERREGLIREANGGTLFLDEIGVMPRALQAKLLRVLEDREVTAVGSDRPVTVDVRFVAGTNANVHEAGSGFREDLLARLGGFVARLPPLRNRREDLGILAAHALSVAGIAHVGIGVAAARRLFVGPLEGNIRVLRQAVTTAAVLAAPNRIEQSHLARVLPELATEGPASGDKHEASTPPDSSGSGSKCPSREELATSLARLGSVRRVADELDVSERTVARWLVRLELVAPRKKTR